MLAELDAHQSLTGMGAATPVPEPFSGQVIILVVNKRDEWVDIQNTGNYAVDLQGWSLVSERDHQDCPLSGTIDAGQTLRIYPMDPQGAGYSCGYTSPIWYNSQADTAVLYDAQGIEISKK